MFKYSILAGLKCGKPKNSLWVRFQVLTSASVEVTALRDIAPCSLIELDRRFRGAYSRPHRPERVPETTVYFYETTWRFIQENSHLHLNSMWCGMFWFWWFVPVFLYCSGSFFLRGASQLSGWKQTYILSSSAGERSMPIVWGLLHKSRPNY
jgi:hypothetical protein